MSEFTDDMYFDEDDLRGMFPVTCDRCGEPELYWTIAPTPSGWQLVDGDDVPHVCDRQAMARMEFSK